MQLNKHPILMQSYEVSQAIEACGASELLTAAVIKSSALGEAIEKLIDTHAEQSKQSAAKITALEKALTAAVRKYQATYAELVVPGGVSAAWLSACADPLVMPIVAAAMVPPSEPQPATYQPSWLRPHPPRPRGAPLMYAMGVERAPNEYAMSAGPTPRLSALLEIAPTESESLIIQLNPDETELPIYRWSITLKQWERIQQQPL